MKHLSSITSKFKKITSQSKPDTTAQPYNISTPSYNMPPRKWIIIPALCLLAILSCILIDASHNTETSDYRSKLLSSIDASDSFSEFQNDLFRYEVTANSVTTAYILHHPEQYNIPRLNPILSDFSSKNYTNDVKNETSKKTVSALSKKLSTFQKDTLKPNDQLTYDLLKKHLALNEAFCGYTYYETLLGKTTGAAANLPVTLSEYPLQNSENVETYLKLLKQVPDYFDNVIAYEDDRAKSGLATPVFLLKDTEKELSRFIKSLKSDDNCFVSTFLSRIRAIPSLSQKDRSNYISTNKYYVNQYIIPAYEKLYAYIKEKINLTTDKNEENTTTSSTKQSSTTEQDSTIIDAVPDSTITTMIKSLPDNENHSIRTSSNQNQLKSTYEPSSTASKQSLSKNSDELPEANTSYGLAAYPGGKEYYELLVKDTTGSYRPVQDLIHMTEQSLNQALSDVLYIATTNPDAYLYYCDHPVETGFHSPDGILEVLSLMIREDYPLLESTPAYRIKIVSDSLAEMVSPAFYMIPAIDDYQTNTIYINPLYTSEENGNLFTTLAHEGFPGHLYQTVYFNQTKPSPIRQILDYPGYVEGWATYVELNSFSFIDFPKYADTLPILYRSDTIINLALSSRIDLGVNYEGWTLSDTCKLFEDLGFNSYYAADIYSYVVEAPGNYLSYFIGCLEIEDLKTQYRNLKMENYSDLDFHKALLDIGPGDFDTIREYLLNTN